MNKKIVLGIAAVVILSLVGVGIYKQVNKNPEKNVLKIGANLSLSGNISTWSTDIKNGMDLYLQTFNKNIEGKKVQIVYEDNKGQANLAVNNFSKLSDVDKVNIILSAHTPIGQALRDLATKTKMPLIATVTSVSNFASNNDYVFRDFPFQSQLAPAVADYTFKELKLKKGSYIVVNDDFGLDGAKAFEERFSNLGGALIKGETFKQSDNDFRNQISKVLKNKLDFIFIVGRDMSLVNVVKQLRELNKNIKIIGVIGFDSRTFWDNIGDNGNGIVFSSAYTDYSKGDERAFKDSFLKQYNQEPNYLNVYGFTIAQYLCDILVKTNGDREKINTALKELNINTIRGKLIMNSEKDVISPVGIYERVNGNTILLQKIE